MSNLLLEVKNLVKSYSENNVLKNVCLKIRKGTIYGLLGKNGAGKTTLLECIEGIKDFNKGEIIFTQENINLKTYMGVQLQNDSLPNMLKVKEALELFSATKRCYVSKELINKLNMNDLLDKYYYELSTGQKRLVSLFLALNHNPEIVLLDEPTAGLDVEVKINVYKVIEEYKKKGTSFILTSHDMSEVERIADTVGILMNGSIVYEGSPNNLTASDDNLYKITYLIKENHDNQDGVILNKKNSGEYNKIITSNITISLLSLIKENNKYNTDFADLRVERPTLEEAFIKIIDNKKEVI